MSLSLSAFARKIVSGDKARFKDDALGVDLDLAYLTDKIIMMGYPASGVASFYRNKGEDVKRFLQHRHQDKYWVFNFCPLSENSYPSSLFDGRVSRYPFPDHHAPPLAILALATREMNDWIEGDPDRTIVLHCKAGKGRTGTLACAYLLSTKEAPSPPKLKRSYTDKEWARLTAEKLIRAVDSDSETDPDTDPENKVVKNSNLTVENIKTAEVASHSQTSLNAILDLHTSRRMKPPEKQAEKVKRGVSIASQRRFLSYWSILLLAPTDIPANFWSIPRLPAEQRSKVYLTDVRVRMMESSNILRSTIKAVSSALEVARWGEVKEKGKGDIWISLARYDDALVDFLEEWEVQTRDSYNLGRRKPGTGDEAASVDGKKMDLHGVFADGRWDNGKMVKSFARLGVCDEIDDDTIEKTETGTNRIHILRPLPATSWVHVQKPVQSSKVDGEPDNSSTTDLQGASEVELEEHGVLLDADREVRAKLYMGEVPFGWFWFIPAFHMRSGVDGDTGLTEMRLNRKDVDFPIGPGSWLVDVTLNMRWAGSEAAHTAPRGPRKRQTPENAGEMVAVALAEGDVSELAHAVQGNRD